MVKGGQGNRLEAAIVDQVRRKNHSVKDNQQIKGPITLAVTSNDSV